MGDSGGDDGWIADTGAAGDFVWCDRPGFLVFAGRGIRVRITGWWLAVAAVGFFGVPIVVAEYVRDSVPAISRSALFAMVPIVVVMVLAAGEATADEERGARRFLVPALVGLGGFLLLLPLQFSGSVRGWLMLGVVCVAVTLVGIASVWLYRLLRGVEFADAVAVVGCECGVSAGVECSSRRDCLAREWIGFGGVDLLAGRCG
ncbi:MAG: hypothetical protein ABI286_13160 [Edaphobacter sp.]